MLWESQHYTAVSRKGCSIYCNYSCLPLATDDKTFKGRAIIFKSNFKEYEKNYTTGMEMHHYPAGCGTHLQSKHLGGGGRVLRC